MQLTKPFEIRIRNTQEMLTARGVLKALGYNMYRPFLEARTMEDYDYITIDERGQICRGNGAVFGTSRLRFDTLQEFLNATFAPEKTPAQVELEKLEAQAEALQQQIATLKSTIQ